MAFLEIWEISYSPVDVKVNVCNTILSDKGMENECHLIKRTGIVETKCTAFFLLTSERETKMVENSSI